MRTTIIIAILLCSHGPMRYKRCLIANEVDPQSMTQSHLTVEIVEETDDYYVTHRVWDHYAKEWEDMDYRVIDKVRAPDYVTEAFCPRIDE